MGRWGVDFTLAQVHLPRGHHLSTGLAQGYRGLHGSPKELKSSQEGQRAPPPPPPSFTVLRWAAGPAPKPGSGRPRESSHPIPKARGSVEAPGTRGPVLVFKRRLPQTAITWSSAARASTDVRLIRVCRSFPQAVQLRPGPGGVAQGGLALSSVGPLWATPAP